MIPTTIAGSLPKPDWLAEPEKLWAAWRHEGDALIEAQQKSAKEWIEYQESVGIDIVSDGEQFRKHFVHGFLEDIEGIDWELMTTMGIRNDRYDAQVPTVNSNIRRKGSVHGAAAKYCRSVTNGKLKFTLPGPMTICDTIANAHYDTRPDMAMAFAEILNDEARELEALGVDVIQFDEPAFNAFTKEAATWGVECLNRAVEGLKCKTATHICYGYGIQENIDWKETLGSEWRQYEEFFPALNNSNIQQVSLECANAKVPISLIGLLKDKEVLVGSIDVASREVESAVQVAGVLREALKYLPAEQIVACTNCGLAPLSMEIAQGKLAALGAGAEIIRKELA